MNLPLSLTMSEPPNPEALAAEAAAEAVAEAAVAEALASVERTEIEAEANEHADKEIEDEDKNHQLQNLSEYTELAATAAAAAILDDENQPTISPNGEYLPLGPLPPKKKRRTKWSETRHTYKGILRRTCLCGKKECFQRWKAWIDLCDTKRQGYYRVGWASFKQTPMARERTHHRDVLYMHLLGHASPRYDKDDPKRTNKHFIAFHHFDPSILQEDNKGPMNYVPPDIASKVVGYTERDRVQFIHQYQDHFHPVPNYSEESQEADLQSAQASKYERVKDIVEKFQSNPKEAADEVYALEVDLQKAQKDLLLSKQELEELQREHEALQQEAGVEIKRPRPEDDEDQDQEAAEMLADAVKGECSGDVAQV
jgi:hypothetical protein